MKKITVLVPSVRETRAADKVLETVKAELEAREGVEVNVVDLKDLQLPFFDNPKSPADESFKIHMIPSKFGVMRLRILMVS